MADNNSLGTDKAENTTNGSLKDDVALIERVCRQAGEIALGYFGESQNNDVWYKEGHSPVSQADMAVNAHLQENLMAARPDYGWLSEETIDDEESLKKRAAAEFSFVVDPIDGTRGFINHQLHWCISVAILQADKPVAGVLVCPALNKAYTAYKGGGAYVDGKRLADRSQEVLKEKPIATGSSKLIGVLREEGAQYFEAYDFVPSLAYRLAMVADGEIDVAFARSGAKAWDVAAAHIILEEAGCVLKDATSRELVYKKGMLEAGSLIASPAVGFNYVADVANQLKFLQKHFTFTKRTF